MGYGQYSLAAHEAITRAHQDKGGQVFTGASKGPIAEPGTLYLRANTPQMNG